MSLSGFIEGKWPAICHRVEQRSKLAHSFLRRSSMVGWRRDQKTLPRDSSNAGKSIVRKTAAVATRLLKSDKLSPRQTAQSRSFEFSRGTLRLQFAAVDSIAKHLGHDFISAKEVDLKTMRLFLRARFCVNATNVSLRIRIRTSSHNESYLNNLSNQLGKLAGAICPNTSDGGRCRDGNYYC